MVEKRFSITPESKDIVLSFAIVACVILAFYVAFVIRTTIVYTHLFYIPIILAGMWYYKRAVYVAFGLGVVHILVTHFSPLPLSIDVFGRAVIFVVVAYVIGLLSEQRAKGEDALRESEEKYSAFFKTSRDPVFITSKDGRWLDFNDAAVELLGYESKDELFKVRIPDLYEKTEERQRHTKIIDQEGFTKDYPVNLRRKDGSITNTLITSVARKDENGNIIGYHGTIRDITERKKSEEILKASVEKYRELAELLPETVFETDLEGNITYANKVAFDSFGYTQNDFDKGLNTLQMLIPDDRDIGKENIQRVLSGETIGSREYTAQRKDKTTFPVIINSAPIIHENKPVGLRGVITNITERKQAEEELERLLKELEAKNRELERFTYTVSHDLRSPLVTIQGFTEMVQNDLEQNELEKAENNLEYIAKAATKMEKLLSDTLKLSRIGRIANPPEDVPFGEIVKDALEQTAEQMKSIGVEVSVAEDFPTVHVDRMRIAEVLVNLIVNSINYRGDQPSPKIDIGHRVEGKSKETVFFVRDNGIGIDPSQHEKVFDLFYQVDTSGEGTGAGLAIVKRIIEVHGGRIWIESEMSEGCTVCFTLPVV
jgi:PAS domain S-box-containing protein